MERHAGRVRLPRTRGRACFPVHLRSPHAHEQARHRAADRARAPGRPAPLGAARLAAGARVQRGALLRARAVPRVLHDGRAASRHRARPIHRDEAHAERHGRRHGGRADFLRARPGGGSRSEPGGLLAPGPRGALDHAHLGRARHHRRARARRCLADGAADAPAHLEPRDCDRGGACGGGGSSEPARHELERVARARGGWLSK
mmetsp:Transcript_43529/g.107683  ORF Transcript_43529/g.107683 Transcript_43529/m.107683 type:complete len:203 (-) Transcript_43529:79-687(-)